MGAYPYQEKLPEGYMAALLETLSRYPEDTIARIADPVSGIVSQCKFFPTIAEITEFVAAEDKRRHQFEPVREVHYDRLKPEPDLRQLPTVDERKAYVVSELGYDPLYQSGSKKAWCFDPEKPPADAPWHNPDELRKSAARIAKFINFREQLRKEQG